MPVYLGTLTTAQDTCEQIKQISWPTWSLHSSEISQEVNNESFKEKYTKGDREDLGGYNFKLGDSEIEKWRFELNHDGCEKGSKVDIKEGKYR